MQAIYKYDIPSKVPLNGEILFDELATKCELYEPDLRRILRFAMVYHHVFQERNVGYVAHTAASRRLVEDPHAMNALGSPFDEAWQAFAHVHKKRQKISALGTKLQQLMSSRPLRQWINSKATKLTKL